MSFVGKHNKHMQKAINYLNEDWKTKAFSDEREVPYLGILVVSLLGSQFLTSIIGLFKTLNKGTQFVKNIIYI